MVKIKEVCGGEGDRNAKGEGGDFGDGGDHCGVCDVMRNGGKCVLRR